MIRFNGSLEPGKGTIEVIDNGHGMSLKTIQTTWLEPATLFRKHRRWSEQRHRRVLGEKGIGRFATSRLATALYRLQLETRRFELTCRPRFYLGSCVKSQDRILGDHQKPSHSQLKMVLEVITRRTGSEREVRAYFDWTQFDDEEKYLDEIEVLWEEGKPAEVCPDGSIGALWENDENRRHTT